MKSSERHFFHYTERTYHYIIMHIFKKQKQKQSIIKLNKQSLKKLRRAKGGAIIFGVFRDNNRILYIIIQL
jgi:hypothetical protein